MSRRSGGRAGMTLVEVMLATALAGLAIAGGLALLDQLSAGSRFIARQAADDSNESNSVRVLLRLLADAQTATDSAHRFRGTSRAATYMSLCDVPGGWREACRVTIALDSLADTTKLIVATERGDAYVARAVSGIGTLRYLDLAARDSAWVREWTPSVVLPGAIAFVTARDTTLFPLGVSR